MSPEFKEKLEEAANKYALVLHGDESEDTTRLVECTWRALRSGTSIDFYSGAEWAIAEVVKWLKSQDAMVLHLHFNLESGGLGSRPYQFADEIAKRFMGKESEG